MYLAQLPFAQMKSLLEKLAYDPEVQNLLAAIPREQPVKHPSHATKDPKTPKRVVERRLPKRCRKIPFLTELAMRESLMNFCRLVDQNEAEEVLHDLRASDRRNRTSQLRFTICAQLQEAGYSLGEIGGFLHRDISTIRYGIQRFHETTPKKGLLL